MKEANRLYPEQVLKGVSDDLIKKAKRLNSSGYGSKYYPFMKLALDISEDAYNLHVRRESKNPNPSQVGRVATDDE